MNWGRFASSHFFVMNLTSTSKLSGKALGKYALTASFVLHVGLIAGFSSWQWVFELPSKNQKKIVKVRFLPTLNTQKDAQKPVPVKKAAFTPAQPISVSSSSIPTLTPRSQASRASISQPEPRMRKSMVFPKIQSKPRSAQQIPISDKAIRPRAILLAKTTLQNQSSRQKINFRPSPTHNIFSTGSAQPTAPANVRRSIRPKIAQPRVPHQQAEFSKVAIKPSQAVFAVKTTTRKLNAIRPRTIPASSQTTSSIKTLPAAQEARISPMSPAESLINITAIPRKFAQIPSTDPNVSGTDLSGLFTGKVRQRVAAAKYYPRTARRRGMEGQPVIAFTVTKDGRLLKANLAQTSGYQMLDRAALQAVQQAAPYPEIPAELKTDTYKFKLPISFVLK